MRKIIITILTLSLLISCDEDENSLIVEVIAEDFETTIDENPMPLDEIGYVNGSSNNNDVVVYEIETQNPEGSFSIDSESGLLSVADATKFDYEINPVITGIVKIFNENVEAFSTVTITLNDIQEIVVTTSDFEITIDENPVSDQLLGSIDGNTNQGEVSYTISTQNPEGAFHIDSVTGELRVNDSSLFDFEQNPILTGVVMVENGDVSENATITVNLNDISNCIETNEMFQQELINFAENNNLNIAYTLDVTTHEYTFTPNSNELLCSIGYQAFDETPYLIQIEDNTNNLIIFEQMISFSSTEQDIFELDTSVSLLADGNYTIRRIQNEWTYIGDVIGFIIEGDDFPINLNGITILSSDFYGTGGPIPNFALPLITLGFE